MIPTIKTSGINKLAELAELFFRADEVCRFLIAVSALRFGILFRVVIAF